MPHHGPVQPVLGHDAAPPPGLARLPLLRPPVLKPDLEHKIDNSVKLEIERELERRLGYIEREVEKRED